MSEHPSQKHDAHAAESSLSDTKPHRSLLERLTAFISPEPENRLELLEMLQDAHERKLIDADALSMIEGVFQVSDLSACDIMVPRPQMEVVDIAQPIAEWMPYVIKTAHSRFPAIDRDPDKVVGVLLAKDLLRYYFDDAFDIRSMLRPAVFIPESKKLNVLLRDFRINRNHMAMVVDEYGSVSGLVTIEDVLEQIVGDIADEYDFQDDADNILAINSVVQGLRWRVKGSTPLLELNQALGEHFLDTEAQTVSDLILSHLGYVPHKGEQFVLHPFHFEILRSDGKDVQIVLIERLSEESDLNEDAFP